jgi:hypothetical protein
MPSVTPGPTSLVQKYKVILDCSHSKIPSGGASDQYAGTATPEKVIVEFYDELNQLRGINEASSGMTSCKSGIKYQFHAVSEFPITSFVVKIGGANALGLVQAHLQVDGKPPASWKLDDDKLWCLSKAEDGGGSSPTNIDMKRYLGDGEKCQLGYRFAVSPNSVEPVPECTSDTQDTDCPTDRPICSTSGECSSKLLPVDDSVEPVRTPKEQPDDSVAPGIQQSDDSVAPGIQQPDDDKLPEINQNDWVLVAHMSDTGGMFAGRTKLKADVSFGSFVENPLFETADFQREFPFIPTKIKLVTGNKAHSVIYDWEKFRSVIDTCDASSFNANIDIQYSSDEENTYHAAQGNILSRCGAAEDPWIDLSDKHCSGSCKSIM